GDHGSHPTDLERPGADGEHAQSQGQAQANAVRHREATGPEARRGEACRGRFDRDLRSEGTVTDMPTRKLKPTTPGQRGASVPDFSQITRDRPEKALTRPLKKKAGRNSYGRVTARHQGGGHKRQYRVIDFKRDKDGVPAKVASIEYDPSRTARIALLHYADGEKRYILAPQGLAVGDTVVSGPGADIRIGNAMPLFEIPLGTTVHNVELKIGRGGQLCRSAGTGVQVVAKEGNHVTLRLRSTEMRMVRGECL